MRRVPFFISMAALASAGCATDAVAIRALPELSVASLSAPDAAPDAAAAASGWSEVELAGPARPGQDPTDDALTSSPWELHFTVMVGERSLDEDDWEPFDSPTVYGLEVDETSPRSGHGVEAGFFFTNDEDDDVAAGIAGEVEFTTYEFYFGVRHTFRPGQGGLHPFVSAGIDAEHGRAKLSAPGVSETDGELIVGGYARAGLLWDLNQRLRLGADYRYFIGENIEIFDESLNTDYGQLVFSLGFAF